LSAADLVENTVEKTSGRSLAYGRERMESRAEQSPGKDGKAFLCSCLQRAAKVRSGAGSANGDTPEVVFLKRG
jgi:hypothetical protein